jgi:transposase
MVFNVSCNTKLFETWLEQFLIKELKPAQVMIMDNAAFHRSQKTKELIEYANCKLLFLPPYSPNLNPIEELWANMKRWVRSQISQFAYLYDALVQFFKYAMST